MVSMNMGELKTIYVWFPNPFVNKFSNCYIYNPFNIYNATAKWKCDHLSSAELKRIQLKGANNFC